MDIGVPELLIILVLVILLFGVGRISKVAGELGNGIRAFREGLQGQEPDEEAEKPAPIPPTGQPAPAEPIESRPPDQEP